MKTILIADDEAPIRRLIQFRLEKDGYRTLLAQDGLEAVFMAQQEKPDLIIFDIMMPKLDGFSAARKLKEDPSTASIPFIFLTAKGEEADRITAHRLGCVDFMVKPFSPKTLSRRIATLLFPPLS